MLSTPIRRFAAVAVVLSCAVAPVMASAEPMRPSAPSQNVGDLQARAKDIAAQLERLRNQSDGLNEDQLDLQVQLGDLTAQIAANQAEVDAARAALGSNQDLAKQFAVNAYLGGGTIDPVLLPAADTADASRRTTFIESVQGDRQRIIEDVQSAQQDLADKEAELGSAQASLDRKAVKLKSTRSTLESTIAAQEQLLAQVNGDLATAVTAEEARAEAAAAAEAERQARDESDRQARAAADRQAVALGESQRQSAAARQAEVGRSASRSADSEATSVDDGSETDQPSANDRALDDGDVAWPDPGPVPAGIESVLARAREQLGVPYRWGASSPGRGFDCSGLVLYAYQAVGRALPHSSRSLRAMTQRISAAQLQPGDLVFGGNPVHHVGMYIGGGQMIHAPHSGDVVKISGTYSSSGPVTFGRL